MPSIEVTVASGLQGVCNALAPCPGAQRALEWGSGLLHGGCQLRDGAADQTPRTPPSGLDKAVRRPP